MSNLVLQSTLTTFLVSNTYENVIFTLLLRGHPIKLGLWQFVIHPKQSTVTAKCQTHGSKFNKPCKKIIQIHHIIYRAKRPKTDLLTPKYFKLPFYGCKNHAFLMLLLLVLRPVKTYRHQLKETTNQSKQQIRISIVFIDSYSNTS